MPGSKINFSSMVISIGVARLLMDCLGVWGWGGGALGETPMARFGIEW